VSVTSLPPSGGPIIPETVEPIDDFYRRLMRERWFPVAALLIAFLVLVILADRFDAVALTAPGTFTTMLILGSPILLAGLGGLYSERAGIVNIGLEGMMTLGTWFAAWGGIRWGPWAGLAFGIIGGAAGGLIHAIATVGFGVDHIVSGVAINILAPGITRYLSSKTFAKPATESAVGGGSISTSPTVSGEIPEITVPFLSGGDLFGWKTPSLFGWIEKKDWFYVSDLAGALRGLTTNIPLLVVIAIALVPVTAWLLWRTRFGLRLRSAGENPFAADSLGVRVYRFQTIACLASGGCAGFGGAMLVLETTGNYKEGQVAGRGFIGLAALIFGNWRPTGVLGGAGLFGYADGLARRDLDGKSVRGLVLFLAICAIIGVAILLARRMVTAAGVTAMLAGLMILWFVTTDEIPEELVFITAPVLTLVVLVVAGRSLRPPRYDGYVWRRGEGG
jgi:general nucleoside transport system permease protein